MSTQALEVLDPLSKRDARTILNRARRHFRNFSRNLIQFSADLRRLQNGRAHLLYGFSNFGQFAQHEFPGLAADNAKQLSRAGAAALVLESAGRISLDGSGGNRPGATGLRALATVLHQHGQASMLAVYDRGVALQPDRPLVRDSVRHAMGELIAPAPAALLDAPDAPPADVHELRNRVQILREHLDDLLDALAEQKPGEARHALAEAEAEMREVGEALALAFAADQ